MSAARYTAQKRLSAIAQGSKVQYANHRVSTDTISNGLIPCLMSYRKIFYSGPPKCLCPPPVIPRLILDGGLPNIGAGIVFGGNPASNSVTIFFGGSPGSTTTTIIFGGYPNTTVSQRLLYTGGSATSSGGNVLDGGTV